MLLRPRRSLVPVAEACRSSWPWGSALPTQTTMATTLDSRPTCKFRAPRRAALHECQIKSAQSSVFHTDFIYVRW